MIIYVHTYMYMCTVCMLCRCIDYTHVVMKYLFVRIFLIGVQREIEKEVRVLNQFVDV